MASEGFASGLARLAGRVGAALGEAGGAALGLVRDSAPDERLALAGMLKLAELTPALMREALTDPERSADLVFCLGGSEIVAAGLAADPSGWLGAFDAARAAAGQSGASMRCDTQAAADKAQAARVLGGFKREMFLKIVVADLLGRFTPATTMRAMSELADECIRAALEIALRIVGPGRARAAGRFCVIAMGKLGALELNLSSDIDLMYLFDGAADGEAATKLAEVVTELLAANCFRVDLRLRPGGNNSPLVASLSGALGFYQSYGQTWERAALLRARPAAGALEVGRRFVADLGHFIYRRYLDFDTLRQLRAMKHRIEQELRSSDLVERNIKLGYGGIRELEFVVQSLTLIYGGRDPRLRVAETLEALERLEAHGYLDAARARRLGAAYLFLRDVEHKLQAAAGLQTHTLPRGETALRTLAARLKIGKHAQAAARLETALHEHRSFVATQFRETLAGGELWTGRAASEPASQAWRAALSPAGAAPLLKAMGFARPAESTGHLMLLARGPRNSPASPRRRELLERLAPRLLDEIAALPDPDLALMNLASFIAAVGARTSFLQLLEEHPATRRVLLRLFASSDYLSAVFIRHPEMLDTLVRSDLARATRPAAEMEAELSELLKAARDLEERLDALRAFRHQEFLRIAIADLAGELELPQVQAELTALAEAVLRQALTLAREETAARHPIPAALELCTVAMGRLGAGEMTYNSDLDLIFIYRDVSEVAAAGHEIAARIAQKLSGMLESRTREGYAYKLDTRLRPSGNAGALVTSLDGFIAYHREHSAVWERQALVRARAVAGNPKLAQAIEAAREEIVFSRGLKAAETGEIAAMRARMEREIGAETRERLNLKQGRGGLVDVEFLTQMIAMRYGGQRRELRRRATLELVLKAGEAGILTRTEAEALAEDYVFLSRLENRLRIETDQASWALPADPAALGPLARRMGYEGSEGAARMLAELRERRDRIRATFERVFARERLRGD